MATERTKTGADARQTGRVPTVRRRRPRFAPAHTDHWTPALGRRIEQRLQACADQLARLLDVAADEVEWRATLPPFRTDLPREQAYVAWRRQRPVSGRLVSRSDLVIADLADALRRNWTVLRAFRVQQSEASSEPPAPRRPGRRPGRNPFLQALASDLADLYWAHGSRKPTRRYNEANRAEYGPFREFVMLVLAALPRHVRQFRKGGAKTVDSIVRLGVAHINRQIAAMRLSESNKIP